MARDASRAKAAVFLLSAGCGLLAFAGGGPADSPHLASSGPDVTVYELNGTTNYGAAGGIRGYAVGTTSCNVGDQPLNWCNRPNGCGLGTTSKDHPVIAQNMYRLKDGRFQQIGASWLKHGFSSFNSFAPDCGSCTLPPLGERQLGVGCTDAYGSTLNGNRPLGRRSEVNPATGDFPYPGGGGGQTAAVWNQRMAVAEADLEASQNPGAIYYIEGQYVSPDDAAAGNALNNASYGEVTVAAGSFDLEMAGPTVRERSAIEVWPSVDPTVELIAVDVPSVPRERFHVARKATSLGGGWWHYEYAVHNLNSARAAQRLTIEFGDATTFDDIGFRDVDAHSGEPYDTTDWPFSVTGSSIAWAAPAFVPAENGNALRWATTYNFFFDASRPPDEVDRHTLGLFTAGTPPALVFWQSGPAPLFADGFESGDLDRWSLHQP